MKLGSWKHRHYGEHAVIVALLIGSISPWLSLSGWVDLAVREVGFVALITAMYVSSAHQRGDLCETCIGSMPLDTDAAVKKRMWALRAFHTLCGSSKALMCLITVLLVLFAATYIPGIGETGQNIIGNSSTLLVVCMFVTSGIHRRLYPWCPWCRHGGRGDGEHEETPTPSEPVNA